MNDEILTHFQFTVNSAEIQYDECIIITVQHSKKFLSSIYRIEHVVKCLYYEQR